MNIPADLLYSKTHEWVKLEGDTATMGLSDYAQEKLGDLVFVILPAVGDEVISGDALGDVEAGKAVSDVYCPVSGIVAAVNEALLDAPQVINETPYEAWFIRVEGVTGQEDLLSAEEYEAFLAKLEEEGE